MSDPVRINGNIYGWGSIKVKVDGDLYHGFDKVDFGDKRGRVKQWGTGRHQAPRGRTSGKYEPDPTKLRGPKSTMQALRAKLAAKSSDGTSYGNSEFLIVVQWVEPGEETPINVEIQRCVIVGDASSNEENGDPSKDEVEIDCMYIIRNGLTLFDASQGIP
jgi:hypothetical protein